MFYGGYVSANGKNVIAFKKKRLFGHTFCGLRLLFYLVGKNEQIYYRTRADTILATQEIRESVSIPQTNRFVYKNSKSLITTIRPAKLS